MRRLALIGLFVALAIAVAPAYAPGDGSPDGRYKRAHAAAVKYRGQRDHVQELLAGRVRQNRALRRALVNRPSSLEALRLAAVVYGVDFRLEYRIASCESMGPPPHGVFPDPPSERTLYADAKNPGSTAKGLAQALDGTWASSPFAAFSPYSPYASALFIGYELKAGHLWQWAASRSCWS